MLRPGQTIGILGGGQLGRMLAMAAARLGLRTHVFEPDPEAPAAQTANAHMIAAYEDQGALAAFAEAVDVVTLEFENVPAAAVAFLEARVPVRPGAAVLAVAQDRVAEKTLAAQAGAQTAPFVAVDRLEDAQAGLKVVGLPAMLKTRRAGYDGKGQRKITSEAELAAAVTALGTKDLILEGFVPFIAEFSVIGARGLDGAIALFDPPVNVHRNHILDTSTVPSGLGPAIEEKGRAVTRLLLDRLNYVGVMAVEFFALADGAVLVNEIAPRVHNSGHWTLEACIVSQFEQQIRAVAGWPLGDPARHSNAVMTNLIGAEAEHYAAIAAEPGAALHLYGKKEIRAGRKMGHITRLTGPAR